LVPCFSVSFDDFSAPYAKRAAPEIAGSDSSSPSSISSKSQEPQGYYAVVTAGARGGPSSGAPYHVALQLTCHDSAGLDLRAPLVTLPNNNHYTASGDSAASEINSEDESTSSSSDVDRSSSNDEATGKDMLLHGARQVASDSSAKLQQALRFERRLAGSSVNTTAPTSAPSLVPSLAPSTVPSLAPSDSPTLLPSVSLLPSVTPAPTEVPTPDLCQTTTASCGTIVAGNTTGKYGTGASSVAYVFLYLVLFRDLFFFRLVFFPKASFSLLTTNLRVCVSLYAAVILFE